MRYVVARFEQEQREKTYRIYVTDSLKILMENTANMTIADGKSLQQRYAELMGYKKPKEETRTSGEIIDHIRSKFQ